MTTFLFKLRLLNGPLQGRELALPAGELTLGQGDVDLQVPLEGTLTSVVLLVTEHGVILQSAVPCWVDGQPWQAVQTGQAATGDQQTNSAQNQQQLPLGSVIDIAGQGLVLGTHDSALPLLSVPVRAPVMDELLPGANANLVATPPPRLRRWRWVTGASTLTIATVMGVGSWLLSTTAIGSSASAPSQAKVTPWLTEQLKTPSLTGLSFAWQPDGTLRFAGHCHDSRQLNTLLIQLRRYGLSVRDPVVCQDQLLNNVRYVLNLFGYEQVSIKHATEPGTVVITGQIQADERWRQVVDMLAVLPGLEEWRVVNQSDDQLKALIAQLRKAALLSKLSVTRVGDRLVISGQLDAIQQRKLNAHLEKFAKNWKSANKVIYQNIRSVETQNQLFPAEIVSVGGSAQASFLELANGVRLQVGARLPSGYQIVDIDGVHGVELSKEGQLIHVPLDL